MATGIIYVKTKSNKLWKVPTTS